MERSTRAYKICQKALVSNFLWNTVRFHFSVDNLYTWRTICSRCYNHVSLPYKSASVHCCFELYSFAHLLSDLFIYLFIMFITIIIQYPVLVNAT